MFVLLYLLLATSLNADGNFDINSDDLSLSLMGNLEGRSIIIKIKDKDGKKLGVFKPNSGSTLYRGEYASYKLAAMTGISDIYPPTQIECMNVGTQKKIRTLLAKNNFSTIKKEENRLTLLKEITRNIEKKVPLCGAYKVWINDLQFYYEMGTLDNLKKHSVFKYMLATGPQPPHKRTEIKQCTELVEPKGCYVGFGYADEMAKDMSSIMLIDAVMGDSDRFPGGNVHFRSIDGNVVNRNNTFMFGRSRLFCLDNGAVLKPQDTTGLDTLKRSGISRFLKTVVLKLKELKDAKKEDVINELKITPEEYEIFKSNLDQTVEYINKLEKRYKRKLYFLKN
jgi:hypothetical protein